jgi:hypothetical protein
MRAPVATCAPATLSGVAAKHLPFFRTSKKLHDRPNQAARPAPVLSRDAARRQGCALISAVRKATMEPPGSTLT